MPHVAVADVFRSAGAETMTHNNDDHFMMNQLSYRVLTTIARDLSSRLRERRPVLWVNNETIANKLKAIGIKITSRNVWSVLQPLQDTCLRQQLPDLTALVVMKPPPRKDMGQIYAPLDAWWRVYDCGSMDITFWFDKFKQARDFDWPEELSDDSDSEISDELTQA